MSNTVADTSSLAASKKLLKARSLRPKMMDHRKNKDNRIVQWICKVGLPGRLRKKFGIQDVIIDDDSLKRLKALDGKRVIVDPLHPKGQDPEVVMTLGIRAGQYFNFMAARESFDLNNGINGFFMERNGCFSVVRGATDIQSIKTARSILIAGKQKLVIFGEGEIRRQNDLPFPFEPGIPFIGFSAMDELDKAGKLEPVYVLPVALKYSLIGNAGPGLDASLANLEAALGVTIDKTDSLYKRLVDVCIAFYNELREEYGFDGPPVTDTPTDKDIDALRNHVFKCIANILHIKLLDSDEPRDCLRKVRNACDALVYTGEEEMTYYKAKRHMARAEAMLALYPHIRLVQVFSGVTSDYVKGNMSQDRMAEMLDKLELAIFGETSVKGDSVCVVEVGNAVNLMDLYPVYKTNKKKAIAAANDLIKVESDLALATAQQKQPLRTIK